MKPYLRNVFIFSSIVISSVSIFARARPVPPIEAFSACEPLQKNDSCQFELPERSVDGFCRVHPQQSQLLCVPLKYQNNAPPGKIRRHTVTQSSGELQTLKASIQPISNSEFSMSNQNQDRHIKANGISMHDTGFFPNSGNPNVIHEQQYSLTVPLNPRLNAAGIIQVWGYNFGIAVNGVPFDPGAAEWYLGDRRSKWQYAALSGAIKLGLDENFAHVQPSGEYHYHGTPTGLLQNQNVMPSNHSPIIGWAADGYPVYAMYGYQNALDSSTPVIELSSSYKLKTGQRPQGAHEPGGRYDGTFTNDYEYIAKAGALDECNGRYGITPDYPEGTYAYFLSARWPVIPRCFMGKPDPSFRKFKAQKSKSS